MIRTPAPELDVSTPPDDDVDGVVVEEIGPEYVRVMLDRRARRYLHMSGEEFVRRWREGVYADDPDQPNVIELAMLIRSPIRRPWPCNLTRKQMRRHSR